MKSIKASLTYSLLMVASCTVFAASDDPDGDGRLLPGQTVKDRPQPQYDPKGYQAGSFLLFPQIKFRIDRDNNIFRTESDEESDLITALDPSLHVISNWSRHSIKADAGANFNRYRDNENEDNEKLWFDLEATIDADRDTAINPHLNWYSDVESRGSADEAGGRTPTEYDTSVLGVSVLHRPGRIVLEGGFDISKLDYSDVKDSNGANINNDDRDREEQSFTATIGYEIKPGINAFVRYGNTEIEYDSRVDDNNLRRDSSETEYYIGTDLDLTSILMGEVALGQVESDYDDPRFDKVRETAALVNLYWHATPLTTVTVSMTTSVEETTDSSSPGFVKDNFTLALFHELRRNLVLEASYSLTKHHYESNSRKDDIQGFTLKADYDINRSLFLIGALEQYSKDSNQDGTEYDRTLLSIAVGLRY